MNVGFTGTRFGMTSAQKSVVEAVLAELSPNLSRAHHGDCAGADAEFFAIARRLGFSTVAYPASDVGRRWRAGTPSDYIHPEEPALVRNRYIVNVSDMVIAAPKGFSEEVRSSTWATIRFARRKGVHLLIVYPDGNSARE